MAGGGAVDVKLPRIPAKSKPSGETPKIHPVDPRDFPGRLRRDLSHGSGGRDVVKNLTPRRPQQRGDGEDYRLNHGKYIDEDIAQEIDVDVVVEVRLGRVGYDLDVVLRQTGNEPLRKRATINRPACILRIERTIEIDPIIAEGKVRPVTVTGSTRATPGLAGSWLRYSKQ